MPAKRKYTDEQYALAVRLLLDLGLSLDKISQQTGIEKGSIRGYFAENGYKYTKEQKLKNLAESKGCNLYSVEQKDQVCKDYLILEDAQAVADKHGISKRAVKGILNERKVKLSKERFRAIKAQQNTAYNQSLTTDQRQEQNNRQSKSHKEHWNSLSEEEKEAQRQQLKAVSQEFRANMTEEQDQLLRLALRKGTENGPLWKMVGATSWNDYFTKILAPRGMIRLSDYKGTFEEMLVKCIKGHKFPARANNLQQGSDCPLCNSGRRASKNQIAIYEYACSLLGADKVILGDTDALHPFAIPKPGKRNAGKLELDVYIPELKFAIEHEGLYHHSSKCSSFEHGESYRKWETAQRAGIQILAIFEDEWWKKSDLIKTMIKYRLGLFDGKKYRASKLEIKNVDAKTQRAFFDANHLSGYTVASWAIGLWDEDTLLQCASIRHNPRKTPTMELARMATATGAIIQGGAAKLIKEVRKRLGEPLLSYSNNRIGDGEVYRKLGFQFHHTKPSYYYTDCTRRISRWSVQKIDDIPEIKDLTEEQQALLGFHSIKIFGDDRPLYRIEDYGTKRWVLP